MGGAQALGPSTLGSHTSEMLTSVMCICEPGLPSSLFPFSGSSITLISFGPPTLSHSQAMSFSQGAEPITDHQVGYITHAGSQGEPFLRL